MSRRPTPQDGIASAVTLALAGISAMTKKKKASGRRNLPSSGNNGMNPTARADLLVKPPSALNVPTSVPRMVASLLAWDTVKFDTTISVASSGTTEQTFYFTLQLHPQYASWASLFDQYAIVQASVTFRSELPPGSTSLPPILYSALDFDNSSSLGSLSAYEDFSTCELKTMSAGAVVTRSVRPCQRVCDQF